MNSIVVVINGKEHTVTRLACGYTWKFVSVSNKRESFTMNATQMVNAGLAKLCGVAK